MNTHPLTVILADGRFPQHNLPLQVLKSAKMVVCCDGAAKKLIDWGRESNAIVGDLDSLPAEIRLQFADRIYQSTDQETNDLTKAVQWCVNKGIKEVAILGATGLREDHSLGNISLLADYASIIKVEMMTDSGIFTPILATTQFSSYAKQNVSIFAITPDTEITTHGLTYAVHRRKFANWWQGSLNQSEGAQFTIEFENGKLIIYQTYSSYSSDI